MPSRRWYGSGNSVKRYPQDSGWKQAFDSDRDGRLSKSEYRAMVAFMQELEAWWRDGRRGSPPKLPRGGR